MSLADQYQSFRNHGGFFDLTARTTLRFTGADRLRYLNGQLTANLLSAKAPAVVPACVTTAKGKLCAEVRVTLQPDAILIDADAAVREALVARLERYIVADDVTLEDVTDSSILLHVLSLTAERLQELTGLSPQPATRLGQAGFDLRFASREAAAAAREKLAVAHPILSDELLEIVRIERGLPRWGAELDENTFPSEAGLDRTHVDFHKGCYIGQEVISRLRSVGHANRELRGFTSDAPLAPGARLFTPDDAARDLGVLTSATHSFALDQSIALGYLRRGAPETGLLAASADSPDAPVPVTLHSLPFAP